MKKSEAAQDLQNMVLAIQKYRSVTMESFGASQDSLAKLWPWMFGEKCPLPALTKVLDIYGKDGTLSPLDYYNMMTVLYRFIPEVIPVLALIGARRPPEPEFITEWEEE